ncbi:MAG TPA: class I SAM-dependent RNA methyltransferase [Terriglobales bacterium]|nr:class I SAM-dependent RNA methyltransferase [Terriglobales bacterium]
MELTIEKLVYGGDGLARLPADERGPGKAVFLPFVLPGERVEASLVEQKKGFARARVENVLGPSPARIAPACVYFGRCGGCHYQHTGYEHQLKIKVDILRENLRRMAKVELEDIEVHASLPWNYRNRTRLQLRASPGFTVGYFKLNSHELMPIKECPISSPLINRAIRELWEIGRAEGVEEIEFFANADDSQLLVETYGEGDGRLGQSLSTLVPEVCGVAVFPDISGTRARRGPPTCAPQGAGEGARPPLGLTYKTRQASYRVSAGAFFQINRHLTDELVTLVTTGRSGHTALDLYAGVGLFSTVLSRKFDRVIAVESSPVSGADLQSNSPANVKAVRGTAEQYLEKVSGKLQPDLVVVDPPRSGLGDSVVQRLVSLGAPRVTYVSCDPATLSRDLRGLLKSGYRVEQAHLVDLFPQTYHLESVFHLLR